MDPRLVDIARRSWKAILGAGLVGALLALSAATLLESSVTSASTVIAVSDDAVRAVGGDGLDVDELRQVVVAVAQTGETATLVAEEAGLASAAGLRIEAESETRSPVIELTVSAPTAEIARKAADALPTVLGRERQRILSEALGSSIGRTRSQISEDRDQETQLLLDLEVLDQQRLTAADPVVIERLDRDRTLLAQQALQASTAIALAQANLDLWEETVVASGGSVTQVEQAEVVESGPAPTGVAMVGLAAGAIAAFGLSVVSEERRRARRERFAAGMAEDDVSRWYFEAADEPRSVTLAEQGAGLPLPRADQLVRYRGVLASVLLPSTSVIAVAGLDDYDGSGATAIALAHAYAGAGRRVVLVSVDVPPLSASAEEHEKGLHEWLTGGASLDDVLLRLDARHGDLRYLPPGALGSVDALAPHTEAFAQLVRNLVNSKFDLVILELPPLLSANGAVPLCRLSHGVILSTIAGRTSTEDRERAARRLRSARSVVLGEITHEEHLPRPIFVRASEAEGELIDLRTRVVGA